MAFRKSNLLISEPKNDEELWRDVREYLTSCGYYDFTTKYWVEDDRLIIDYGEKNKYFAVSNMTVKDMKDLHVEVGDE